MPKIAKTKKTNSGRPIVYDAVKVEMYRGDKPLSAAIARKMLGWQEQDAKAVDYDLIDHNGKKIKLWNNLTNRPIYISVFTTLKQEILRKRWVLNGEAIILGKTGLILNGQHTLIALILAAQEWTDDSDKWPDWEHEPHIEKIVVSGIEESDTVVNTMDTCKPRTFADAIYRSGLFPNTKGGELRKLSRVLDFAVKMLWHRTGSDKDAFAPRRTHSEGLAFIANHPKIIECVRHIYEEDGDKKKIGRYISTGYAAGMMYLMGCCRTQDVDAYKENPRESSLDFSLWDEACDFWVKLAAGDKSFAPLKAQFQSMVEEMHASLPERSALIVKAWNCYSIGEKLTADKVKLTYNTDEDGFSTLGEYPEIGGIDMLEPVSTSVDPSPEELQERAETIKAEKADKKKNGKGKKAKPATNLANVGDQVWIYDADEGGYWTGKVAEIYEGPNGPICKIKVKTGKTFEEPAENCLTEEPVDA